MTAANPEGASSNLASISPFFIVKDLQVSIAYYIERLGFQGGHRMITGPQRGSRAQQPRIPAQLMVCGNTLERETIR